MTPSSKKLEHIRMVLRSSCQSLEGVKPFTARMNTYGALTYDSRHLNIQHNTHLRSIESKITEVHSASSTNHQITADALQRLESQLAGGDSNGSPCPSLRTLADQCSLGQWTFIARKPKRICCLLGLCFPRKTFCCFKRLINW